MEIEKYLLSKGVKPHYKGFKQLVYAIELCKSDETYLDGVTTRLYPDIATDLCTTRSKVERDIRFAIQNSNSKNTIKAFINLAVLEMKIKKPKKGC